MREYKMSQSWAIFIYISAPLIIALSSWVLVMPFVPNVKGDMNLNVYWFLVPILLGMIIFMTLALFDTIRGKFVIDNDKVFTNGIFSHRQLLFNEIKGYRVNDKHITIESINDNKKNIKISLYFGNLNEIIKWLSENYSELNLLQTSQEKYKILNSYEFGWTVEQREIKLKNARKIAQILNWTGGLVGAWVMFFANPYEYSVLAAIAVPLICLFILKFYNGLIITEKKKYTPYPAISLAIVASSLGLFSRALFDFNIFNYSKIWILTIVVAIIYVLILIIGSKEFEFNKIKTFLAISGLSLIVLAYSFGAVVTLNCMYDKSEPEIFNAIIISKRINSGKSTFYYLKLTPWGYKTETDEVSVPKDMYNRLEQNDKVNIYFMKGKFDIPWFVVAE